MNFSACLCLLFFSPCWVAFSTRTAPGSGSFPLPLSVSVSCSRGALELRVTPPPPGLLRLGRRCRSNGVDRATGELLFTYPLSACGSTRQVRRDFLLYRFVLRYGGSEPGARGGRVHIECRLRRLQHVYRLAVRPTWETPRRVQLKGPTVGYRIRLMDDRRTAPHPDAVRPLRQRVNVRASAVHLPPKGRLYVDRCHATPSAEPRRGPRHVLVENFGCMVDPSGLFTHRTRRTINYSFNAFQFSQDPTAQVFLHCRLFVSAEGPGPTTKSCSYSSEEKRWRSLAGPHSVCDCCDSFCVQTETRRSMSEGFQSSGPLMFTAQVSRPRPKDLPISPSPDFRDDDVLSEVKTDVGEDPVRQDLQRHGHFESPSGEGVGPRPQVEVREAVRYSPLSRVAEARFLSDCGRPQEGGLSNKSAPSLQGRSHAGLSPEGGDAGWVVEGEDRRSGVGDVLFLNGYDGPLDI
ncbi:zona pellucida sperm-binding protein 3-like [Scleropages formosus]|uniref:zona pellucida sperm-binding protein 3-like n=1 Tax=Scleropages formosus TaxID=113540 RepID=UPI0010FAA718|nr:zona pellucida sperm-binding protein 3-like [Scleropages formosus]